MTNALNIAAARASLESFVIKVYNGKTYRYYTGKAENPWFSENINDAMVFQTWEGANRKADVFTRMFARAYLFKPVKINQFGEVTHV